MGGFLLSRAAWKEAVAAAQAGLLTRSMLVGLLGSSIVYASERQPDLAPAEGLQGAQHARAISAALFAALEPGCVELVDTHLSAGGERFSWPPGLDEIIAEARKQIRQLSVDQLSLRERGLRGLKSLLADVRKEKDFARHLESLLDDVRRGGPLTFVVLPMQLVGPKQSVYRSVFSPGPIFAKSLTIEGGRGLVCDSFSIGREEHMRKGASLTILETAFPRVIGPDSPVAITLTNSSEEPMSVGVMIDSVFLRAAPELFVQEDAPNEWTPDKAAARRSPESINESETEKESAIMAEVESVISDEQWDAFSPDVRALIRTELLTKLRQGVSLYHLKEAASVWLRKPF